jgi:hypothetical protein
MTDLDIEKNIREYLGDRSSTSRYTSFDYCFNYFQFHREEQRLGDLLRGEALQLSCLHLGFYLASWGMLRGSSELLRRSMRTFVPVVEALVSAPPMLWTLDVDGYDSATIDGIINFRNHLRVELHEGASDILVTKVMLGTMGCVPAFDSYFTKGFRSATSGNKRLTFSSTGLQRIAHFYRDHGEAIERHRVLTLDFDTGEPTSRRYTRAKVIDMIFFIQGGA